MKYFKDLLICHTIVVSFLNIIMFLYSNLNSKFKNPPFAVQILNLMNISQNNLIRYMTGLSRNSHVLNTRKVLKILSIDELFKYMKLIFV